MGLAAEHKSAETSLPTIAGLRVGFDGHYKVGVWTPVEVVLRGGKQPAAGRVSLVVPDGEGVASRTSTPEDRPCRVQPGKETRVALYARFGRVRSTATVSFETSDGATVQRQFRSAAEPGPDEYPTALESDRRLIVCVSSAPLGVEEAAAAMDVDPEHGPAVARLGDLAKLPEAWYGYEGVDAVVVATVRPQAYLQPDAELDAAHAALDRWVQLGGRLLAVTVAAPSPDAPEEPAPVSTVRGFGRITAVTVEPDQSPSDRWGDRGSRLSALLDWPKQAEDGRAEGMTVGHLGFTDMSGQLRGALDRYDGVWTVPFGVVVAVLVVYLVIIGPIDYFVLARLKRLTWTWITFPLVVVLFGLGAYVVVYRLKGSELRSNQADLVDVDVATGLVRGTHWSNLYSPRVDIYDLSLATQLSDQVTSDSPANFAWLGLPGSGLGGMDPKTVNPSPWRVAYRFSPALDAIDGLPIQTWSTRSFTGRWSGQWKGPLGSEMIRRDDEPGGRLTNPLDVELKRCLLIYDRWVYDLGTLGPRKSLSLDVLPERAELRTLLTGSQRVMDEQNDRMELRVTPYNALSVEVSYILRAMMFYEHAGGREYTHLSNRYQPFVDLSYLLGPDRAMLIGLADTPVAQLCRDGKPLANADSRRVTVFRAVFPVKESK